MGHGGAGVRGAAQLPARPDGHALSEPLHGPERLDPWSYSSPTLLLSRHCSPQHPGTPHPQQRFVALNLGC